MTEFLKILEYKELLRNLVARDLKVRYKRSMLGFFWVILNPLLMLLVLDMVFSGVFKVSTKNYTAYLLSGIILWNFFSQSTSTSVSSLIGNSTLIKKVYIPKAVFPLSVVLSAVVNFLFSLIPLFFICYLTGATVGRQIYLLPLIVLLVGLFAFGIALLLSTLTVFFHDTTYIYEVLLLAWMYLTPVFYPESIIPRKFLFAFHLNPFYYFMEIFRCAIYLDAPDVIGQFLIALLFSLITLAIGWFAYSRYKDRIVYYL